MFRYMVQFLIQMVQVALDLLEFIIDLPVLRSKSVARSLVVRMQFPHGIDMLGRTVYEDVELLDRRTLVMGRQRFPQLLVLFGSVRDVHMPSTRTYEVKKSARMVMVAAMARGRDGAA